MSVLSNREDAINAQEVSLFIGGREFVLENVADEHNPVSLHGALSKVYEKLTDDFMHAEREARVLDFTEEETRAFLGNRLVVLRGLLEQLPCDHESSVSPVSDKQF